MPSPMKVHTIEVRRRPGTEAGRLLPGAHTQVLVDGQPLAGVKKLTLEFNAKGLAEAKIEMYGDLVAAVEAQLQIVPVARDAEGADYELGRMEPRPDSFKGALLQEAREQATNGENGGSKN